MDNKEAIEYLKWIRPIRPYSLDKIKVQESIDLAIKVLEGRPHGEWKVDDKIYCSECGASICDFVPNPTDAIVIILENKFCYNCGADMQKGDAK